MPDYYISNLNNGLTAFMPFPKTKLIPIHDVLSRKQGINKLDYKRRQLCITLLAHELEFTNQQHEYAIVALFNLIHGEVLASEVFKRANWKHLGNYYVSYEPNKEEKGFWSLLFMAIISCGPFNEICFMSSSNHYTRAFEFFQNKIDETIKNSRFLTEKFYLPS